MSKRVDGDIVAMREVEMKPRSREPRRERGLAAPAVRELDRLRTLAQALAEQPAQARARGDVAVPVARKLELRRAPALIGAEQLAPGARLGDAGVEPDQHHL